MSTTVSSIECCDYPDLTLVFGSTRYEVRKAVMMGESKFFKEIIDEKDSQDVLDMKYDNYPFIEPFFYYLHHKKSRKLKIEFGNKRLSDKSTKYYHNDRFNETKVFQNVQISFDDDKFVPRGYEVEFIQFANKLLFDTSKFMDTISDTWESNFSSDHDYKIGSCILWWNLYCAFQEDKKFISKFLGRRRPTFAMMVDMIKNYPKYLYISDLEDVPHTALTRWLKSISN